MDAFDKALNLDRNDAQTWKYKGNALLPPGGDGERHALPEPGLGPGGGGVLHIQDARPGDGGAGSLEDAMDSYAKALEKEPNEPPCWRGMA